ncbi:EthD protein [compost metagenome]
MHTLTVMYPHPESPEHFRAYYFNSHLPLAKKLPGLRAQRYSFDVEGIGSKSPYFCIWQGDFDDAEAMSLAMASAEGQAVTADVKNYASGGLIILHHAPVHI